MSRTPLSPAMIITCAVRGRLARGMSRSSPRQSISSDTVTLPAAQLHKELTIGWIGIPLNAHYLKMLEPALRAAAKTIPLKLKVVGAAVPPEFGGKIGRAHV